MENELRDALLGFAKSDVRRARRVGELYITDTKRGKLRITHAAGVYTLETDAKAYPVYTPGEVIAIGGAAAVARVLAGLYSVAVS